MSRALTASQSAQTTASGHSAMRIVSIVWPDATRYYIDRDPSKSFSPDANKSYSITLAGCVDASKRLDLSLAETYPALSARFSLHNNTAEHPTIKQRVHDVNVVGLKVTFYKVYQPATGSLTSADWITLGVYSISKYAMTRMGVDFECIDIQQAFLNKTILRTVTQDLIPAAPSESCNKIIPLVFGSATAIPAIKVSTTPMTTLDESITDSETELVVIDGSVLTAGAYAWIDSEKILIQSIATNTLTVARGVDSTDAAEHNWGATVEQIADVRFLAADCALSNITNVRAADGTRYAAADIETSIVTLNGTDVTYIDVAAGGLPRKVTSGASVLSYDPKDLDAPLEFRAGDYNTNAIAQWANAVDTDPETRNATAAIIYDSVGVSGAANGGVTMPQLPLAGAHTIQKLVLYAQTNTDLSSRAGAIKKCMARLEYSADVPVNKTWPSGSYRPVFQVLPGQASACAIAITGVTTGSPMEVTTATAHGLDTNDYVWVRGVQNAAGGDSACNGQWQVTVTAYNKFTYAGTCAASAVNTGSMVRIYSSFISEPIDTEASSVIYPDGGDSLNDDSRDVFEATTEAVSETTLTPVYVSGYEESREYTVLYETVMGALGTGPYHVTSWPRMYGQGVGAAIPNGLVSVGLGSGENYVGKVQGEHIHSADLTTAISSGDIANIAASAVFTSVKVTIEFESVSGPQEIQLGIYIEGAYTQTAEIKTPTDSDHDTFTVSHTVTGSFSRSDIDAATFILRTYATGGTNVTSSDELDQATLRLSSIRVALQSTTVLEGETTKLVAKVQSPSSRIVQKIDMSELARVHNWSLFKADALESHESACLFLAVVLPRSDCGISLNVFDLGFEIEEVTVSTVPTRDSDATMLLDADGLLSTSWAHSKYVIAALLGYARFAGMSASYYDETSLLAAIAVAEAQLGSDYLFSRVITENVSLMELLCQAVTDAGIRWCIDSGKIKFFAGLASAAPATRSVTRNDRNWSSEPSVLNSQLDLVANRINLTYNAGAGKLAYYDPSSQAKSWGECIAEYEAKWIASESIATVLVKRMLANFAWPMDIASYVVQSGRGADIEIGVDTLFVSDASNDLYTVGRVVGIESDDVGALLSLQIGVQAVRNSRWERVVSTSAPANGAQSSLDSTIHLTEGTYIESVRGAQDALNFYINYSLVMVIQPTALWTGSAYEMVGTVRLKGQIEERRLDRSVLMVDSDVDSTLPLLVEYSELNGGSILFGVKTDADNYVLAAMLKSNGSLEVYGGVTEEAGWPTDSGQAGESIKLVDDNDLYFSADGGDRYCAMLDFVYDGDPVTDATPRTGKLKTGRIIESNL